MKPVDDPSLMDFSKSRTPSAVKTRLCECGAVHLTFHDDADSIFASADFTTVEDIESFAKIMQHYANLKKEVDKNITLNIEETSSTKG